MTLALGALYTGNAGTYYAGIETIPASLAGVIVYIYPVFVALLSLRFATRAPPYLIAPSSDGANGPYAWPLPTRVSPNGKPVNMCIGRHSTD